MTTGQNGHNDRDNPNYERLSKAQSQNIFTPLSFFLFIHFEEEFSLAFLAELHKLKSKTNLAKKRVFAIQFRRWP